MTSKIVLVALLSLTFSAKPMQSTFQILEKTGEYLTEFAPEIALVGGTLLANHNERPDVYSPMPMMEEVKYTSDNEYSDLVDQVESIKEQRRIDDLGLRVYAAPENKKPGICNLI